MKRLNNLLVLLGTVILLSGLLCGCQSQDNDVENETNISDSVSDLDTSNVIQEEVIEEPVVVKKYVELIDVSDFSEGIAWVKYENEYGDSYIGWLDTEGKIIRPKALERAERFGGDFSDGYTYVNYDDNNDNCYDSFAILDKQGNVLASSPEGDGYEIVAGGNGVFFVRHRVRTFEINEDQYGFMDMNGKWLYELTANNPFPSAMIDGYSQEDFFYHGDHVFSVRYLRNESWYRYYMFNVESGISTEYYKYTPMDFYEGETVLLSEDEISFITSDGSVIHTIKPGYGEMGFGPIFSEGLMFSGNIEFDAKANLAVIKNGKFYNTDGTVSIDLSQYTLVQNGTEDLYCFKNGFAPIVLLGADYSPYITFIDESGNMMFDPVEADAGYAQISDIFGGYSDGVVCVKTHDGEVTINCRGEIRELSLPTYVPCGKITFHDGYARFEDETRREYIVGMNGTVLQTYVEE